MNSVLFFNAINRTSAFLECTGRSEGPCKLVPSSTNLAWAAHTSNSLFYRRHVGEKLVSRIHTMIQLFFMCVVRTTLYVGRSYIFRSAKLDEKATADADLI